MALAAANEVKNDCNSLTNAKLTEGRSRRRRRWHPMSWGRAAWCSTRRLRNPRRSSARCLLTVGARLASVLQLGRPRA